MKPRFAALVHSCLAVILLTGLTNAQVQTGVLPFGSYSGGPFDTVNLGNLNVHFAVPIRHKAGRGVPFIYDLAYDNSIWQIVTSGSSSAWQPVQTAGSFGSYWGWIGLGPVFAPYVSYQVNYTVGNCYNGQQVQYQEWVFSNFVYYDKDGTPHRFGTNGEYFNSPGGNSCPPNGQVPTTIPSSIADGYTLSNVTFSTGTANGTLTDNKGTTFGVPFLTSPPTSSSPFTATDSNGNKITETNGVYTDTLGTVVLSAVGTQPSNTTFTYLAPNEQNVAYTVSYVSYTVHTAFNCTSPTINEYPATTQNLVDTIQRPDGTVYQFKYEPTPNDTHTPHYVTGRISEVDLPTGGKITYSYSGVNCADGTVLTLTRKLDSNTAWQYSRAKTGTDSHWQTTVTDPTTGANQTVIDFQSSFYETQRVVHQGSSTGPTLSTTISCYNTASPTPTTCPTTTVSAPINRRTVFSYLPDAATGVAAETDTQYSNGDIAEAFEVDSYDYGSKAGGVGSLLRKVITTFGTFNPVSGVCFALGNSINVLPCMVTVQSSTGTIAAKATYTYDEVTPTPTTGTPQHTNSVGSRGNLTTLATQVNGTTTLYRKFTYFDTGTPNTATDAGTTTAGGANVTSYIYDNSGTSPHTKDCGNSFATTINEPLPSMSRSFAWDCDGGVMTSATDENGKTATAFYTGTGADLFFWRPYKAQDQMTPANTTTLTYPSAVTSETSMLFNGNNSVVDHRSKLDDFGRPIIAQTLEAPSGSTYDAIETDYDVAGRVSKVSQPYATPVDSLCSGTCPGTAITYDALGRTYVVTDGGGGTLTSTYSFNDALQVVGPVSTGEHLKQKQLEYNALGWLTSVCEITSVTGSGGCSQNQAATGFLTKYSYNLLGNIIGVTQNAQAATGSQQTRNYTYDMLGRLTSELNPETGSTAITYVYDAWDVSCGSYTSAGDLVEKKDAMQNVTCMKYDAQHRMTDMTYPSGTYAAVTDQKHFVYDAATVNGTGMLNAKNRLAEAYTGTSASKKTDLGFSYSARGEVTDVWESTPNSGAYYHVTSQYWANHKLNTISGLPGLPTITYGVDGEGRPSTASAATGQNPVTAAAYNVASQITGLTLGSADSDSYQYDPNTGRMTQYSFKMGTGPTTDVGVPTWNANGTLQQLQITDHINTANSQTCTFGYDDLVRITSANCGSVWSQTFGFDPFGNLSKTGSAQFLPTYTGASGAGSPTNQYYQITGGPAGTSNYYDTNGNLKNDVTHAYTWDADGNNLSTDGTAVTVIYDALDRMIEQTRGSTHTQIVYGPYGMKLALMNGQSLVNAFIKLPGGARAVYSSAGLAYYRHADHLGSSRLATTPTRTKYYDVAYAPYGEDYNGSGTQDLAFTDQNQDTVKGGWSTNLFDFMAREYRTAHGRWTSPDPGGLGTIDPTNPQSWNRYAYVLNDPTSLMDPFGYDDDCYSEGSGSYVCGPVDLWWGSGSIMGSDGYMSCQGAAASCTYTQFPAGGFDFGFGGGGDFAAVPFFESPFNIPPPSIWSDALGLPSVPCQSQFGPWCDPSMLPNPWMLDAEAGWTCRPGSPGCYNVPQKPQVETLPCGSREFARGFCKTIGASCLLGAIPVDIIEGKTRRQERCYRQIWACFDAANTCKQWTPQPH